MVTVRNKLNQRIMIHLTEEKNIDLLAKGTATITEKESASPHLQSLIANKDVVIISTTKSGKPEPKPAVKDDDDVTNAHKSDTTNKKSNPK